MDKSDNFRVMLANSLASIVRVKGFAPLLFHNNDLCSEPFRHLSHSVTEVTLHKNEDFVAIFNQVSEARFHSC